MPLTSAKDIKERIRRKFQGNVRRTVALFSRGNVNLQRGKFFTQDDMESLRERVNSSKAIQSL